MTETLHTRSSTSPVDLQLLSGTDYFSSLSNAISSTVEGDRVAVTTMGFDPDEPLPNKIVSQLNQAGSRNVTVALGVDAFALLETTGMGPFSFPKSAYNSEAAQRRMSALSQLAAHSTARYGIINMPTSPVANLFAGRSHMKLAVINDQAYLGGPSFQGCDRLDMVVGISDKQAADWLYTLATNITDIGDTNAVLGDADKEIPVDNVTDILIDVGKPGQSHILSEAMEIIDTANEHITIASQFLPTGEMGKKLAKAIKRGVDVHIAYNHPSKFDRMNLAHHMILAREKLRKPPEFFNNQVPLIRPPLHAKAIVNESTGMVGSHNLVETGVKLGTPEIALRRRTSQFAQAVRSLLLEMTKPTAREN